MFRVALVESHVIQYHDPFFRLLAAAPDVDLTVLFCSRDGAETYHDADMKTTLRWDLDLLQGYRHEFLRNFGFGEGYTRLINPRVFSKLLLGRFDAAILFLGWGTITSLLAIAACRMSTTPFFLFGDSSHPPLASSAAGQMRAGYLRALFGLADGFLVSGKLNADYYQHYGADPSRFFLVPWAIDNERFTRDSAFAPGEREALRAQFGFRDDQTVFVFSAKLVARKDPMTLLRALDRMPSRDRAAALLLGHGELREELERFARERNLIVHFAGFVNQRDLPKYYAAGDAFVLPSLFEPRGSVVNEAMACGLPVIVTDVCGSIGDIAIENENALIYPAGDADALAAQLERMMDAETRARMAERSRTLIADWSYERGVEGVLEALRARC